MRAILLMYDSLNRHFLNSFGFPGVPTPNFDRLLERSVAFDNTWVGSMPCMPARRELHTGRYNFLHRSWGPLEPFDDSMPELLRDAGIHTHLVSDHYHYWEDGGATYHQRYTTWENIRGQEGDSWAPLLQYDEWTRGGKDKENWKGQDQANRSMMTTEEKHSQTLTFDKGLEFLEYNHAYDNWFLQLETFDPHEPFFVPQHYKERFPDSYNGPEYDWPPYRPLNGSDSPESVEHLRACYSALLTMCDHNLGRVLDAMDRYDLWKDTMLIVCTDHGHLLGEHGQLAKCHCPFYEEVAHTPLFIWDPRYGIKGQRRGTFAQTIDIPATILDYFGLPLPEQMQGRSLAPAIPNGAMVRKAGLFGIYGGQICCTDGEYVYMRSPNHPEAPKYEYTLMPTCHGHRRAFYSDEQLRSATLSPPLSFSKGMPLLRTQNFLDISQSHYPTLLYRLDENYNEQPVEDAEKCREMEQLMRQLMEENDCPSEVYDRYFG